MGYWSVFWCSIKVEKTNSKMGGVELRFDWGLAMFGFGEMRWKIGVV